MLLNYKIQIALIFFLYFAFSLVVYRLAIWKHSNLMIFLQLSSRGKCQIYEFNENKDKMAHYFKECLILFCLRSNYNLPTLGLIVFRITNNKNDCNDFPIVKMLTTWHHSNRWIEGITCTLQATGLIIYLWVIYFYGNTRLLRWYYLINSSKCVNILLRIIKVCFYNDDTINQLIGKDFEIIQCSMEEYIPILTRYADPTTSRGSLSLQSGSST